MIEINLSSGQGKKSKGRAAKSSGKASRTISSGGGFKNPFAGLGAKIGDPYLIGAVGGVALALLAVGFMFTTQDARAGELAEAEARAVQDSTRYAAVIRERRKAEAQRDSVLKQLDIIRSIDDQRYVWPHLMDELSKALPPYTWLHTLSSLTPAPVPAAAGADSVAKAAGDSAAVTPPLRFLVGGQTADIQALTRYMRMLEASPFVQNVQLVKTQTMLVDGGKEVTDFQLNAEWQRPDPMAIRSAPVSLSVR